MRVIECPTMFQSAKTLEETPIFLAGGISNCPNWQKEMIARFKDMDDNFVLLNPRRETFNVNNPGETAFQIEWEYYHLHEINPRAVLFWFPHDTLCPITLYELGMQMGRYSPTYTKIFIGCHPGYARKEDVEIQTHLAGFKGNVHDNFESLVDEVKFWYCQRV